VSFAQVHITILKNKDYLIVFFLKKKNKHTGQAFQTQARLGFEF
jgi:hypothetical protein